VTTLVERGRQAAGIRLRRGVLIRRWASHAGTYRMSLRRGPGSKSGLDTADRCSIFVLTEVETLGVARSLGWRLHMRCANGYRLEPDGVAGRDGWFRPLLGKPNAA
jgi:hypothetical protein